jgi:hypothetical protein
MNIRPYIHVKGAYIREHELVNDVYYKFVRELTFMNARLTFMNVSPFIHRLTFMNVSLRTRAYIHECKAAISLHS